MKLNPGEIVGCAAFHYDYTIMDEIQRRAELARIGWANPDPKKPHVWF